jgi:hypothetical protein
VAGYHPEGDGCQPEVVVTCAGQHTTGDAFEPDECPALARRVDTAGGQAESHTLSPAADEDWVRFAATAKHVYAISATGASGARLHLDLYGTDGTTVLASDHGGLSAVRLAYEADTTADLLVRVRAPAGLAGGAYDLSLADLGADDHGDLPAEATPVALDAPPAQGSASLETPGDVDVFSFSARSSTSYAFLCTTSAFDCNVTLYDARGGKLLADTSSSSNARLVFVVTGAGTYYVAVQGGTPAHGAYTWKLEVRGTDDHGDTPANATLVLPSSTRVGARINSSVDVDVFAFNAQAGHIYEVYCSPKDVMADFVCDLSLLDAAGKTLATDTQGFNTSTVRYEFATEGTWYFAIKKRAGLSTDYSWVLLDLGLDDHGDSATVATPVTSSIDTRKGELETPGDSDWFAFTAEAGHIHEFYCFDTFFSCALRLLDAAGRVVGSDSQGHASARVVHEFAAAGTYYVQLSSSNSQYGRYSWRLKDLGVDDYGDSLATATRVTPSNDTLEGNLETPGDSDWFAFDVQAGQAIEFHLYTSDFERGLVLMNAAGTTLASNSLSSDRVRYKFTTAGTYYVQVRSKDGRFAPYSWKLRVDDHADTSTDATVLTLGTASSGRLEVLADKDYFSVRLAANTAYSVRVTGLTPDITVYLPGGYSLLANDSSVLSFTSSSEGTYYVKVDDDVGAYSLVVQ